MDTLAWPMMNLIFEMLDEPEAINLCKASAKWNDVFSGRLRSMEEDRLRERFDHLHHAMFGGSNKPSSRFKMRGFRSLHSIQERFQCVCGDEHSLAVEWADLWGEGRTLYLVDGEPYRVEYDF